MTQAELTLPRRSFGQTMRADVWWAQPLIVFLGLGAFVVYSTWAAFQGEIIISARISRRFIRRRFLALRRTVGSAQTRFGGRPGCSFLRRFSFSGRRAVFGSPVIITVAPTTRRSGPIRRPAPSVSRARPISASARSRSSCRTCTAIFSISRCSSSSFSRTMSGKRCGSPIRRPERPHSGSASARWCWR